jgi:hypothetical protein
MCFHPLNLVTLASFLWLFRVRMDTFVMIVHFLNAQLEPCHIIVGFFEIANTIRSAMAL